MTSTLELAFTLKFPPSPSPIVLVETTAPSETINCPVVILTSPAFPIPPVTADKALINRLSANRPIT